MKRIWVAAALVLGMVLLCSSLLHYTKTVTDDLTARLERLSAAAEGEPSAEREAKELLQVWEGYEKRLSAHIRHSELEEVRSAFTQIESYRALGEYELYRAACSDARVAVEHLWEEERVSLKNIL